MSSFTMQCGLLFGRWGSELAGLLETPRATEIDTGHVPVSTGRGGRVSGHSIENLGRVTQLDRVSAF